MFTALATCWLSGIVAALSVDPLLEANIAYRSPSLRIHDHLEIPVSTVSLRLSKRQLADWTGNVTFPYGVASGDPLHSSVVLWTLPTKSDLQGWYAGTDAPVCIKYEVSKHDNFTSIVTTGKAKTTFEVGYSFKIIATGLHPYTRYYYKFQSCYGQQLGQSRIGTFKTLPAPNSHVDKIKLACFSCSNYPFGFFNAYGAAANHSEEIDYVQHIGDYIYEYANGAYGDGKALDRIPQPLRECSSLQDYRDRFATYRTDPDLANLHARVAWQAVWDDHEIADNTWKSGSADSNNSDSGTINGIKFSQRKANAVRAYFEWMPIRQVDTDDKLGIYRTFKIGTLADMIFLDTRQFSRDVDDLYYNTKHVESISNNTDRSIMGPVQEHWFYKQLIESQGRNTTWRLIMQQVVFSQINYEPLGMTENLDAWDGYKANRRRIFNVIQQNKIDNFIVLSGDSHASWVNDIVENPTSGYNPKTGSGALGVEFAGSAVSSPSSYGHDKPDDFYISIAQNLTSLNPELQYAEGQLRGYVELTLTSDNVKAEYIGFPDQTTRSPGQTIATFMVDSGVNHLRRPLNNGKSVKYGSLGAGSA